MKVNVSKRENPNKGKYNKTDLDMAYEFTKKIYKEFGTKFIKAVVLFGSRSRDITKESTKGDIDILIVVDDTSIMISSEIAEAYRVIVERLINETSTKLHIVTLRLTNFWEYVRTGDPVAINILRDGVALVDTGFFDPLQILLRQGRIRPTRESVWAYFSRSPRTLFNSKWHLLQATLDLYWAVIDAAHAALMSLGEVPPSPEHVADVMEEAMVKKKLLDKKYVSVMRNFYTLSKMITHSEINSIKGEEYDGYYQQAEDFVNRMKRFIEKR